jgi:hypothetical protein
LLASAQNEITPARHTENSLSSEDDHAQQEIPAIFVERAHEAAAFHRVAASCFAPALATAYYDFVLGLLSVEWLIAFSFRVLADAPLDVTPFLIG